MFNFLKILKNQIKFSNNFFSKINIFKLMSHQRALLHKKKNLHIFVFIKFTSIKKKFIKLSKTFFGFKAQLVLVSLLMSSFFLVF